MPVIDLRSDTVTQPTPAMRQAMAEAPVGDDVYGEDPTVTALEQRIAALLGHEAALFVPSGTMSNQIAIGLHCRPGEQLLCGTTSHVYVWEGGGIARLWGVTPKTLAHARNGLLTVDDLEAAGLSPDDPHYPPTRLVCLENTHNRAGGRVHPFEEVQAIRAWTRDRGLALHLDGARLFNAAIASGRSAAEWAGLFDTVSVCFSKGLGAPVGSALVGPAALIQKPARRLRKVLGGGMRQAGILAAAALYALNHHVDRLADDHAHAKRIAQAVESTNGALTIENGWPVESNLVWITVDPAFGTAADVAQRLRETGVLLSALGPQTLRAVTHLDITRDQAQQAADRIASIVGRPRGPRI
jgi:threonine aldolase